VAIYFRNEKFGVDRRTEAQTRLGEVFESTTNPSYRGAMAVGLGLLERKVDPDRLWKQLEETHDAPLQGSIALALGLMRDSAHAQALRAMLARDGIEPALRLQLARSLALLSDAQAAPDLIASLKDAPPLAATSLAAQALGLIGDKSAVAPLLALLRDSNQHAVRRAFAAEALGKL